MIQTEPANEENSCWNDSDKKFTQYMNNREWFERVLKEKQAREIKIDCDRSFMIGKVLGELLSIYPIFRTCSCVFCYEQGWSWYHTFDDIIWE